MRTQVTVGDIWHLALPPGTSLLGGRAGLGNPVEWVTALRSSFPLFGTVEPGYLAIAEPALARRIDPRLTVQHLLTELHRVGSSALVIDERLCDSDAALADRLALPVLGLPSGTDLHVVERNVLRALVDQEGQVARREMEARQHLQRVYSRGGLQAVLDDVAKTLKAAVTVTEESGLVFAHSCEATRDPEDQGRDRAGEGALDLPIAVAGRSLGHLRVCTQGFESGSYGNVYARQAADICGIEILQQRTRHETEERLGFDLVEQMLDSSKPDEEVLARLARLGFETSAEHHHLAAYLGGEGTGPGRQLCALAAQDVLWSAREAGAGALAVPYRGQTLVLLAIPPGLSERRPREWLSQAVRSRSTECIAGVGRTGPEISGLRRSVRQALAARDVGRLVEGLQSPYYYEQLGLYRLLTELRGRDELERFYQDTLGELERYDTEHGTELVPTLQAFFNENANASRTARVLFVHRNTLNYRLQRIVDITGVDLDDSEARLAIQLALKVRRIKS